MTLIDLIITQQKTPLILQVMFPIIAYIVMYKVTEIIEPVNYVKSYLASCFLLWFSLGLIVKFWFIFN